MFTRFENFTDRLEFKCLDCNTVFDHAVRVFAANPRRPAPGDEGPAQWDVLCIELRCPFCAMRETYRLKVKPL